MSFGWINPLPLTLGGGPTDIEEIWRALRSAEGGEHGPGPEGSDEDIARQVQATAIAAADRAIERAFLQVFPGSATDALSLWEEALRSQGAASDVALRALLELAWRSPDGATTPHLAQALLDISPQLAIEIEDADQTIVTVPGKHVSPEDNEPDYGTWPAARKPNYASRDELRVVYTLDLDEGETSIPAEVERAVARLLRRRLPSMQFWTLCQDDDDDDGIFLLDGGNNGASVLDVTPLS
jgi:hypothetical protein